MDKVGTFEVHGTEANGFWIADTCTFNNWGRDAHVWPTRQEAEVTTLGGATSSKPDGV